MARLFLDDDICEVDFFAGGMGTPPWFVATVEVFIVAMGGAVGAIAACIVIMQHVMPAKAVVTMHFALSSRRFAAIFVLLVANCWLVIYHDLLVMVDGDAPKYLTTVTKSAVVMSAFAIVLAVAMKPHDPRQFVQVVQRLLKANALQPPATVRHVRPQ
jgi:hypothetical protein